MERIRNIFIFTFLIFSFLLLFANVYAWPPNNCNTTTSACGGGGCASDQIRECAPSMCICSWNATLGKQQCTYSGSTCFCLDEPSCPVSCTPSCGGNNCGDDGCGGSCGSCASGVCSGGTCCVNTAPSAPAIVGPANATQVRVGVPVTLDWTDVTNWGNVCGTRLNQYLVCVSSNQTTCDLVGTGNGTISNRSWTPATADTFVSWQIGAHNGALQTNSGVGTMCVEGFSSTNTAYVSTWSACNSSHQRTRTCVENCGTDDCTALGATGGTQTQDCTGIITGTIFDASTMTVCPAFDPVTGYLVGLSTDDVPPPTSFTVSDQTLSGGSHPFAPIIQPTTNNGNYTITAYAPTTYQYNFDAFSSYFVTNGGPKLTCSSSTAVVGSNPTNCNTQPCTTVKNMSFGFNRLFGGWWRATGGSVYAETGIRSVIPVTSADQNLITANAAEGNRLGVLTYGIPRPSDIFGDNTTAQVSTRLWEKQSTYSGPIYDWNYYNNRFNLFTVTTWNGVGSPTYSDPSGLGYQIFKVGSSVSNFSFNPSAGQKAIFLVDGDVTVTSNIVVPNTAFLAVISSGTITYNSNLTRADGWYVADTISVPCHDTGTVGCDEDDVQFSGNGSFIAWNGFNLARHQGSANGTQPAERFTYRQDLVTNAPKPMKLYTKLYKPFVP